MRLVCRTVAVGAPLLKTELGAKVGSKLEELADLSGGLAGASGSGKRWTAPSGALADRLSFAPCSVV
jgi:hypothetical protein